MKAHIRSVWHPKYTLCEIPHSQYLQPADDTMELCERCLTQARCTVSSMRRMLKLPPRPKATSL